MPCPRTARRRRAVPCAASCGGTACVARIGRPGSGPIPWNETHPMRGASAMTTLDVPSRAPLPDASLLQGIALGFLTYGVFALSDAVIKSLGGRLPVFEIGFFAILFSCLPIAF